MKLNIPIEVLLLILIGIVIQINAFVIRSTSSSTDSKHTINDPLLKKPRKMCLLSQIITKDQKCCLRRKGKYIRTSFDVDGHCLESDVCFLPAGTTTVNHKGVIAKKASECILIKEKLYCAADSFNYKCKECSFTQFLNYTKEIFDINLNYTKVNTEKYLKKIKLPVFKED
ncbi:hypothetical protein U3516DRAFT_907531, partial [Neocallimastix sp. 'constans']